MQLLQSSIRVRRRSNRSDLVGRFHLVANDASQRGLGDLAPLLRLLGGPVPERRAEARAARRRPRGWRAPFAGLGEKDEPGAAAPEFRANAPGFYGRPPTVVAIRARPPVTWLQCSTTLSQYSACRRSKSSLGVRPGASVQVLLRSRGTCSLLPPSAVMTCSMVAISFPRCAVPPGSVPTPALRFRRMNMSGTSPALAKPGSSAESVGRMEDGLSPRQTPIVRVCSPASRRVAPLHPRCAGLTAWTPAPRTLVRALV